MCTVLVWFLVFLCTAPLYQFLCYGALEVVVILLLLLLLLVVRLRVKPMINHGWTAAAAAETCYIKAQSIRNEDRSKPIGYLLGFNYMSLSAL